MSEQTPVTPSPEIQPVPPTAPATKGDKAKPPKYYGFSVYVSAIIRWWRAILTMVILIVANLVLQTLFMSPYDAAPIGPLFWLKATLSGITFICVWGIMISAALHVYKGHVSFKEAVGHFRQSWLNFTIWLAVWVVVCAALSLFQFWPGLVAVFITFYVPFAAADGQRNAIGANFKAIGSRPIRYFFTAVLTGILIFGALYLIGGLTLFSSPNLHGVWVSWAFIGLIGSVMTVAWGLLYRSTKPGTPIETKTPVEAGTEAAPETEKAAEPTTG